MHNISKISLPQTYRHTDLPQYQSSFYNVRLTDLDNGIVAWLRPSCKYVNLTSLCCAHYPLKDRWCMVWICWCICSIFSVFVFLSSWNYLTWSTPIL